MSHRRWIIALYTCLIVWCAKLPCEASKLDSLMNLPVVAVPVINYSPETGWKFGLAAQSYFQFAGQNKMSIVQLDGAYSLNRQWYVNLAGNLYFSGKHPWMMYLRGGYRDYPDYYYYLDRGSDERIAIRYQSQRGYATVQPMVTLHRNWMLGPRVDFLSERSDLEPVGNSLMWGFGLSLQCDTRDVMYYPNRGVFLKLDATYYEPRLGSDCRLGCINLDWRQFIPFPMRAANKIVFAWQFKTAWALAANTKDIPYSYLPTIGGQDLIRGVRCNMYRDNALLALQAELRIPIWSVLHATVFAGVGDVYNTDNWQWVTPKIGYGLGLRACINQAKVNIRFDVARNNMDKAWNNWDNYSFYITATEAF